MNTYTLKLYAPKGPPGTTHEATGQFDLEAPDDAAAIELARETYGRNIDATPYAALYAADGRFVREWGAVPKG